MRFIGERRGCGGRSSRAALTWRSPAGRPCSGLLRRTGTARCRPPGWSATGPGSTRSTTICWISGTFGTSSRRSPGRRVGTSTASYFDPARPLIDGPAGSPLGDESFRLAPTRGDTMRVLGSTRPRGSVADGEPVAEVVVARRGSAAGDADAARRGPPGRGVVRPGDVARSAIGRRRSGCAGSRVTRRGCLSARRLPRGSLPARRDVGRADRGADRCSAGLAPPGRARRVRSRGEPRPIDPADPPREVQRWHSRATPRSSSRTARLGPGRSWRPRAVVVPPDDWSLVQLTDDAARPAHDGAPGARVGHPWRW